MKIVQKNCSLTRDFASSNSGATAIEYALIAGGISISIIVSGVLLGGKVTILFQSVLTALTS